MSIKIYREMKSGEDRGYLEGCKDALLVFNFVVCMGFVHILLWLLMFLCSI